MKQFEIETFLPQQIALAATRIARDFARIHREKHGLAMPEWRVLMYLSQEDQVSVREIHDMIEMDKSKVSRAASRLEARGLIVKRTHPGDRRLVELALSETGRALVSEILPAASAYEAGLMQRLGPAGPQFRRALHILLDDA